MGSNPGFGNNGFFPNKFNQEQDAFSLPTFTVNNQSQQYFPEQQNLMGFGDDGNGEDYTNNNFQRQAGLFNGGSSSQNQFSSPIDHFSQPPPHLPRPASSLSPYPHQQLNTEAAEIKARLMARLLKAREQANSATSLAVQEQASQQAMAVESSSSLRGSPRTPITHANVDDLISQYSSSDMKMVTEQNKKQELKSIDSKVQGSQQSLANPCPPAKSQQHLSGSLMKVLKSASNRNPGSNGVAIKSAGLSRHASIGSLSEVSEGEIVEDPIPQKSLPTTLLKQTPAATKLANGDGQLPRRAREDLMSKTSYRRGSRDESPPPRPLLNSEPQLSRLWVDRRDDAEPRSERQTYQSGQNDQRSYSTSEKQPRESRESRDHNKEYRKTDAIPEQNREGNPPNPILAHVLPHDEDLREWLEITGYHNHPYRDKILNRRRTIAKLDAQKNALLAEMEAEERAGPPIAAIMLPPPASSQILTPFYTVSKTETTRSEAACDSVISNKRPYSNLQDEHEPSTVSKILRTDDRSERGPAIKAEDEDEHRRPISISYRFIDRTSGDRRTDRDFSRSYAEGRGHVRISSHERGLSPNSGSHDNRPTRTRGYDSGSDDYFDRDDRDDRDSRRFQVRGGYKGRAYDPNFRGRGRGKAWRGEYQSESRSDFGSSASKIASGKPFKDNKGFSRGGRGETRYFIVKSFNEDNVLKCIDDSIWTTQAQNGLIFKEAFENCKNLILVFSINKSRAFQGYARMESLPGSVEVPSWQKTINWVSAGAFKVKWLVICSTRFHRVGHLRNSLNENQAVLVGKDGQEIEEECAEGLIELIDDEVDQAVEHWKNWDE